jgi:SHS2 domain-containing protein
MHSFEQLEHTADALVRARGDSLAELLVGCAEGMLSVLVGESQVREEKAVAVDVEASDAEELVHAWLRELLFRFSAEGLLFARFEFQEATPTRVRALCHGEAFDPARHHGGTEIKAVTYHHFRVEQTPEGWVAETLFDI